MSELKRYVRVEEERLEGAERQSAIFLQRFVEANERAAKAEKAALEAHARVEALEAWQIRVRATLIRQGELVKTWRCLVCFEEWEPGEPERHAASGCVLALAPTAPGSEAGR